jgi:hypothetical protein
MQRSQRSRNEAHSIKWSLKSCQNIADHLIRSFLERINRTAVPLRIDDLTTIKIPASQSEIRSRFGLSIEREGEEGRIFVCELPVQPIRNMRLGTACDLVHEKLTLLATECGSQAKRERETVSVQP